MAGYGSESGFTAYMNAAGLTPPTSSIPQALQRASVYIDGTYALRFPGRPTGGASQEREWPRISAMDYYGNSLPSDAVPLRVEHATYEAALVELRTPGFFSAAYTPGTQKVLTEVKGIKWEVVGNASKAGAMVPISTAVEGLLAPLLVPADFPAILVV